MRTEIITFRKNYDELKANVDKTKVSQPYLLAVLLRLSFLPPPSLREPLNALPNQSALSRPQSALSRHAQSGFGGQ